MGTSIAVIRSESTKILDMTRAGWSPADIAEELDCTPQAVGKVLRETLSGSIDQARVEMTFNLELERMEALHKAHWLAALGMDEAGLPRDDGPCLKSAEFILKLIGQKTKMFGLDLSKDASNGAANDLISVLADMARERAEGARERDADREGDPPTLEIRPDSVREGDLRGGPGGVASRGDESGGEPRPDLDQVGSRGREIDAPGLDTDLVAGNEIPGESANDSANGAPALRHSVERGEKVVEDSAKGFRVAIPGQE